MSQPFVGEIKLVGFNFAPRGYVFCQGALLSIQQNAAMFSLLGTTFGGDGRTTFALPNLQGRVPLHSGKGPAGDIYTIGDLAGSAGHALIIPEIATHTHTLRAKAANADESSAGINPSPAVALAQPLASQTGGGTKPVSIYSRNMTATTMAGSAIGTEGGGQPHENRQPYLVLNFCIAMEGVYPSPD